MNSKIKNCRALVMSILLRGCESWSVTADIERRISAIQMKCYRRLLRISYKDHMRNKTVREKITLSISEHKDLIIIVKERR